METEELIELSNEAKQLLKAATNREVLKITYMGGKMIQAGGQQFGRGKDREATKWKSALKELVEQKLVAERGYKDEVFELTYKGWAIADKL